MSNKDNGLDIPKNVVRNDIKFGAVIFDSTEEAINGWAARADGEPFRIQGVGDLLDNTLWWTGLDYMNYSKAGLANNVWTRRSDFPKIDHRKAIIEWGMDENTSFEERVGFLAEIFSRIMTVSKNFGIEAFTNDVLLQDFAEKFFFPKREDIPSINAAEALRNTIQPWSTPSIMRPRNSETVILRRPRLTYAADMLRCQYPRGEWKYLDGSLIKDIPNPLDYLFSLDIPFFANITVTNIDAQFSDTIAFGSSIGNKKEIRSWASSPELEILRNFAEIEVHNAWISGQTTKPVLPECISNLLDSPLANSSWSIGIVAENLWRGIMAPRPRQRNQNGKVYTYRGAWIASLDRAKTMTDAIALARDGFTVSGYGGGQVHVSAMPGSTNELIQAAFRLGLHPSLAHANTRGKGNIEVPEAWNGAPQDEAGAILTTMGEKDALLQIDRSIFESPARQLEIFDSILGGGDDAQ